jgi:hypothetical protein
MLLIALMIGAQQADSAEPTPSSPLRISTLQFAGYIDYPYGTLGVGDLFAGTIKYDAGVMDIDPDPQVGVYPTTIFEYSLTSEDQTTLLANAVGTITIRDNSGCDCYFIDINVPHSLGGIATARSVLGLQNEFGPHAFTLFDNDSLPTQLSATPQDYALTLDMTPRPGFPRVNQGLGRLTYFSLTTVPEPSSQILVCSPVMALAFATVCWKRRGSVRDIPEHHRFAN